MKPQERTAAILNAPGLDMPAKMVAIAIASFLSDDDGAWCWPGVQELMRLSSLGERAVQDVLAWAAAPEVGWLLVEHRRGGTCRYAIDWNQLASPDLPQRTTGKGKARRAPPADAEPPHGAHPRAGRTPAPGAPTPAPGAPTPAPGADRTDHDPTRNRPLPSGRASASVVVEGVALPSDLPALLHGDQRAIVQLARHGIGSTAQLVETVKLDPKGWFKSGIGAPVGATVTAALRGFGVDLAATATAGAQGPPSRASPGRRPSLTDLFGTFDHAEPDRSDRIVIEVP